MNSRNIENWKDLEFIASVLTTISANQWDKGARLRMLIYAHRSKLRAAANAFENTYNMPCGYQDAAGDRLEVTGREYMVLVHAYLACRYGALTKRLSAMIDETLPLGESCQ